VVIVRLLIATPKSTKEFAKICPLFFTITIGFPGTLYLMGGYFPDNRLDRVPTTWTVGLFVILLLGFFIHSSLMVFAYIQMSWMAWRSGFFMYIFLSSPIMSKSGCCRGRGIVNRSGSGG